MTDHALRRHGGRAEGLTLEHIDFWVEAACRNSKTVGPAATLALVGYLLPRAKWRPARLIINTGVLGGHFGCRHTAAANWLSKLRDAESIHIHDWDRRTGQVDLHIYDPTQEVRQLPLHDNPQRELPWAETTAEPAEQPDTLPIGVMVREQTVTEAIRLSPRRSRHTRTPRPTGRGREVGENQ